MSINDEKTVFSDETQDMLFQLEADSWWFQYRANVITGLMGSHFDKNKKTVDVGGGNGYTTSIAKQKGFNMALLEPSEGACKNALKRGIDAHVGMMTEDYPRDNEYEQVLLLDVLEHIEDDLGFLALLARKICKGGMLLITTPANMCLWSSEDDYANHFRRYTEKELRKKAEETGFRVLYSGYYMQFLFLPILCVRVGLEKLGLIKRQDERTEDERTVVREKQFKTKDKSIVNRVLHFAESREYKRIMRGDSIAFGASVIMVLQR